jgi:hypothetical protein
MSFEAHSEITRPFVCHISKFLIHKTPCMPCVSHNEPVGYPPGKQERATELVLEQAEGVMQEMERDKRLAWKLSCVVGPG